MKAVLETETITRIILPLEEADRFKLPASTQKGMMTVTKLIWTVSGSDDHSHPITADALDEGDISWTLSLRMADVPDHIRAELRKVLPESIAATLKGEEMQESFKEKFPNT